MFRQSWLACVVIVLTITASADAQERVLRAELDLAAPPQVVWDLWTTVPGIQSFFAPGANIDPRVDGVYEILFSPEKPKGERGAEDLRILAFEPSTRLVFTWNAPQHLPSIRAQRTVVEIRLAPSGAGGTRLTFVHWGWGVGAEWDQAFDYFDKAWGGFVLPSLKNRVARGPIDWKKPPSITPLPGSMKQQLATRSQ